MNEIEIWIVVYYPEFMLNISITVFKNEYTIGNFLKLLFKTGLFLEYKIFELV